MDLTERSKVAEEIARAIEEDAQHEGPRAARVIAMCAATARRVGAKNPESR